MVIKTELCSFSETRCYPGHGMRMVRRDGQLVFYASSKCRCLGRQKKKPAKLRWTVAWRRLHKKVRGHVSTKRRTRRNIKFQRAIVSVSFEELTRRRTLNAAKKDEAEKAAAVAAAGEKDGDKKKTKKAFPKFDFGKPMSRSQASAKNARGGSQR